MTSVKKRRSRETRLKVFLIEAELLDLSEKLLKAIKKEILKELGIKKKVRK